MRCTEPLARVAVGDLFVFMRQRSVGLGRWPISRCPPFTNIETHNQTNREDQQSHSIMESLTIIITLASGVILGYWGHVLQSRLSKQEWAHKAKLERDARLADYEAFLLEWEQRIERSSPEDIAKAYFTEGAAQFRSRSARVRRDFPDRAAFSRLDDALARLNPAQVRGQPPKTSRDVLADAVRALIRHVQSA